MAVEFEWEPLGVYTRFSGFITANELVHSVEEIQSDTRFDDIRYVINDLLNVSGFELSAEALTDVAILHHGGHRTSPYFKIVLISADGYLVKTIRNIHKFPHLASCQIEVFSTVADARAWLKNWPDLNNANNWKRLRF